MNEAARGAKRVKFYAACALRPLATSSLHFHFYYEGLCTKEETGIEYGIFLIREKPELRAGLIIHINIFRHQNVAKKHTICTEFIFSISGWCLLR